MGIIGKLVNKFIGDVKEHMDSVEASKPEVRYNYMDEASQEKTFSVPLLPCWSDFKFLVAGKHIKGLKQLGVDLADDDVVFMIPMISDELQVSAMVFKLGASDYPDFVKLVV